MPLIRNAFGMVRSNISDLVHNHDAVNNVDGRVWKIEPKVSARRHGIDVSNQLLRIWHFIKLDIRWKILN